MNEREYTLSAQQVLDEQQTTAEGLSSAEAERRREKYGPNKLKDAEKPSLIQRFFNQLKDPMLIILMIAAAVSALTGVLSTVTGWVSNGIFRILSFIP